MLLDQHKSHLLAKLPWTPLVAPSARKFQTKKLFGPDYYLILVTDLRNVWLEHVQTPDIYARARESEIAVVEGDSDRLVALIKILSTFLDNVQEIRESLDKVIDNWLINARRTPVDTRLTYGQCLSGKWCR